jgi:Kef-type K+ transport system membrane component KefB
MQGTASSAHELLTTLTVVLGGAGVTTVVFQRLKQPVVLGYILAGLVIGPHGSRAGRAPPRSPPISARRSTGASS